MNKDCLRTGDKAAVHFRFIKTPEYMHCDQKLVFREGRTKAVGTVTKVVELLLTSCEISRHSTVDRQKKRTVMQVRLTPAVFVSSAPPVGEHPGS